MYQLISKTKSYTKHYRGIPLGEKYIINKWEEKYMRVKNILRKKFRFSMASKRLSENENIALKVK
jgi:hypothetical protein